MAVLLFHAFPGTLPGGFIGVDIFFVISGYIITRTYFGDLATGKVSLPQFYMRRVRRLAPVYVVVLLVTAAAAYTLLGPLHLKNFSHSLFTQPLYLQNITFWVEGDYFDNAYTKPLLHTWSLAVEEQFYIAYALLILLGRRSGKWLVPVLIAAMIVSIAMAYKVSAFSPKSAFYWLPTRVWEFSIGILVALRFRDVPRAPSVFLYAAGIAAVAWSIVGFDEKAAFPGGQSILACVGTAMVLASTGREARSILLDNWLLAWIGRLSYSLYLWHWPILAIATTYLDRALRFEEAMLGLALSFFLSHMTFKYVEQPVREKQFLAENRTLLKAGAFASLAIFAVAFAFHVTDGAVGRYSPELAALFKAEQDRSPYRCSYIRRLAWYKSEICKINEIKSDKAVLVMGDSHADQMDEIVARLAASEGIAAYLVKRNCNLHEFGLRADCGAAVLDQIVKDVHDNGIRTLFSISYLNGDFSAVESLENNIKQLESVGVTVYLMKVVPNDEYFNPGIRAKAILKEGALPQRYTRTRYQADNLRQIESLSRVVRDDSSVILLDPVPLICPAEECDFDSSGQPNYIDSHHVSSVGGKRLVPLFSDVLRRMRDQSDKTNPSR